MAFHDQDDGQQEYLNRAANHRLLKPYEEKDLARRAAPGREHIGSCRCEACKARRTLIECNMRLVISIARHYRNKGMTFGDVVQEGSLGLDRAARKFDPALGFRFSTYATLWIRQSIQRGLQSGGNTIRLPPQVAEHRAKSRALIREHGDLSFEELAERLGTTPEKIQLALGAAEVVSSLNREVTMGDEYDLALIDTIADPLAIIPGENLAEDTSFLLPLLDQLPLTQRRVIELRFGFDGHDPRSLADVASVMGISTTTVQTAQREALKTLRHLVDSTVI